MKIKFYIKTAKDSDNDLRTIFIELFDDEHEA